MNPAQQSAVGQNGAMDVGATESVEDELTGLLDRASFLRRLAAEVERAERYEHAIALLVVDVDRFAEVAGADGDTLLSAIAERLSNLLRRVDILARTGSDEFAALLPETPPRGARIAAERVRDGICRDAFGDVAVTVSVGLAVYPADGATAEDVLFAAEGALTRAKVAGGNRVDIPI